MQGFTGRSGRPKPKGVHEKAKNLTAPIDR